MNNFLCAPVSNGNPREQALIRQWWHERHDKRGTLVWEYCLAGLYADAIWFPNASEQAREESGTRTAARFPLNGMEIILCEAKITLTTELIGQALVYKWYAEQAGGIIKSVVIFAEIDPFDRRRPAEALGLEVVIPR